MILKNKMYVYTYIMNMKGVDLFMKKGLKCLATVLMSSVLLICSVTTVPASAVVEVKLPNYPICKQRGGNCWAYAILSMVNYKIGNKTINNVYEKYEEVTGYPYVLDEGATDQESRDVLKKFFTGYNPTLKGTLTSVQIKNEINSNFPVYISGKSYNSNARHASALMGYKCHTQSGPVIVIYYMNPATGTVKSSGYVQGTDNYFYTSKDQYYKWEKSIIIAG